MNSDHLSDWLTYINSNRPNEGDFGLERLQDIFSQIVQSPVASKTILVGGTNGKGSTIEFLKNFLLSAGYKIGSYTSPHLLEFNERIKINDKSVRDEKIIRSFERIDKLKKKTKLTYFDYATLAAFDIFSEEELDFAILEIGIGGKYDPVNLINSDLSIITNISLDHQDILGNDIDSIGKEKAGILRRDQKLIFGAEKIPNSIAKIIDSLNVDLHRIDDQNLEKDFYLNKNSIKTAKKAIELIDSSISKKNIFNSIQNTKILGRCDLIKNKILVDVAHNEDAIKNLKNFIEARNLDKDSISAIFHCSKPKDPSTLILPLNNLISEIRIPRIDNFRLLDEEYIKESLTNHMGIKVFIDETIENSISEIKLLKPNSLILIFGSFYLAGEFYKLPYYKNV